MNGIGFVATTSQWELRILSSRRHNSMIMNMATHLCQPTNATLDTKEKRTAPTYISDMHLIIFRLAIVFGRDVWLPRLARCYHAATIRSIYILMAISLPKLCPNSFILTRQIPYDAISCYILIICLRCAKTVTTDKRKQAWTSVHACYFLIILLIISS